MFFAIFGGLFDVRTLVMVSCKLVKSNFTVRLCEPNIDEGTLSTGRLLFIELMRCKRAAEAACSFSRDRYRKLFADLFVSFALGVMLASASEM